MAELGVTIEAQEGLTWERWRRIVTPQRGDPEGPAPADPDRRLGGAPHSTTPEGSRSHEVAPALA